MQNTHYSHKFIVRLHIVLSGLLFLIALMSVPAVLVLGADNDDNNGLLQTESALGKQIVGSIVITDNPDEIVGLAKAQNMVPAQVVDRMNNRPALVTLSERPDHPRVQALARQNDVHIEPNYAYQAFLTPNDPRYDEQWNLPLISAPEAWDTSTGSQDVTIAVIDSGILFEQEIDGTTYSQPDFPTSRMWTNPAETGMTQEGDECWTGEPEDKRFNNCDDSGNGLIDDWRGWDFMGGFRGADESCPNHSDGTAHETTVNGNLLIAQDNDPQPYACDSPDEPNVLNKYHYDGTCQAFVSACFVGHGTMVASVAAAATNNNELIAGIDHNAKIMNIRALDGYGWGSTDRLVGGLHYAVDNGADVINLSLGSNCGDESFTDSLIEEALQAAADAGIVIVAASGNDNLNTVCYPASSEHVMAIGATDSNDNRTSYSSYSDDGKLDVVAPAGVPVANAPSARINSNYLANAGGTSLSTPHVAGLASLLRAKYPDASRDDLITTIQNTADVVDGMNGKDFHEEYGHGRINLLKALTGKIGNGTYGNIRLIECSGQPYLIERNIRRKRLINDEAMKQWGFENLYFTKNDRGCNYSQYALELDRVIRSRNTGRVYLVTDGNAYWLHSKEAATTWGLGNFENTTYPQFDGDSIHFLNVVRSVPLYEPSLGDSNIRVFRCDGQEYMVERFRRRTRLLTVEALKEWNLEDAYFAPTDRGCSYGSYDLSLERVIRSRTTGREYLVVDGTAYWIRSQEAADSWGVTEDYTTTTYPQFDGDSIHFLEVVRELPVKED